jgi:predicted Zn-dependent protease
MTMLTDETVRYLAATAVIAGVFGMRDKALLISDALVSALPDNVDAQLIAASARLAAGQKRESEKILREKVLAVDPDRTIAKALLGMAHDMMQNFGERDKMVAEVLEAGDDADAIQLVKELAK